MSKWYFPLSSNSQTKGLKDSGIETFKGQLLSSLSREIIQNSLDAKKNEEKHVIVEFNYFYLPTHLFPDLDGFKNNIEESIRESDSLNDKTTLNFFMSAKKILSQAYIPFVRISDFNTYGLLGSKKRSHNNWHNLVMSSGVSDKNAQAGGSFGIGKNATFACSHLHTVFYSTLDSENNEAFEGVANLISVTKPELNDYTQGIGYFAANSKHQPLPNQASFDTGFKRENSGTDIYIPGVKFEIEEFKEGIISGVLNNFLYAIFTETLIVKVNNMLLSRETLHEQVYLNKLILDKETVELLEVLTDSSVKIYNDFKSSEATLYLMEDPDGSRKITAIRKPWMKITLFDGFSKSVDFKGAFIIHGEKTNKLLRLMENPQHDKWETDRLNGITKTQGDKLIRDIRKFIGDKIIKLNDIENIESLELIGADEYIKLIDDQSMKKHKKIKEKIAKIEIKTTKDFVSIQENNPQGEDEATINEGNEDGVFDGKITFEIDSINLNDENYSNFYKERKAKIARNQIKVLRINGSNSYNLLYKSNLDYQVINIEVFPVDEEGKVINGVLTITSATARGEKLFVNKNKIIGANVINGEILINLETNINHSLGLGVNVYEVDR